MKLVQAAASFALTGTGGSCSAVVDLVSVLKGLSIVLRVGVPGLDLIVRRSSFISFTRTVLIRFIESNLDKTIDTSLSLIHGNLTFHIYLADAPLTDDPVLVLPGLLSKPL